MARQFIDIAKVYGIDLLGFGRLLPVERKPKCSARPWARPIHAQQPGL
jgi:hypothetical protein